jgi:hypothetical protein
VEVELLGFFTSLSDRCEWSASCPGRFTSGGKENGIHGPAGRVGPRRTYPTCFNSKKNSELRSQSTCLRNTAIVSQYRINRFIFVMAMQDVFCKIDKKFWEELIAYYLLIQRGPRRKDVSNNSSIAACAFVATGTCLPSRCLAKIGYTYIEIDGRDL